MEEGVSFCSACCWLQPWFAQWLLGSRSMASIFAGGHSMDINSTVIEVGRQWRLLCDAKGIHRENSGVIRKKVCEGATDTWSYDMSVGMCWSDWWGADQAVLHCSFGLPPIPPRIKFRRAEEGVSFCSACCWLQPWFAQWLLGSRSMASIFAGGHSMDINSTVIEVGRQWRLLCDAKGIHRENSGVIRKKVCEGATDT